MPFLPLPLPQQVSLPGDLTSLITGGAPVSSGISPNVRSVRRRRSRHQILCCSRFPGCRDTAPRPASAAVR